MYEDAGEGQGYRTGSFPGAVASRTWTAQFRNVASAPTAVRVNGTPVTGYRYDPSTTHLDHHARPVTTGTTITYIL